MLGFEWQGGWVFECSGVWVFWCLCVWVLGCFGVWVFGCLGVWVFGCSSVWVFGCQSILSRVFLTLQHPNTLTLFLEVSLTPQHLNTLTLFLEAAPAPRPEKRAREPARAAGASFRFIIIFLKENRHGVALRRSSVSPCLFCEIKQQSVHFEDLSKLAPVSLAAAAFTNGLWDLGTGRLVALLRSSYQKYFLRYFISCLGLSRTSRKSQISNIKYQNPK